jgi:hypothetical protein
MGVEHFDSHGPVEAQIGGAVNGRHAAAGEPRVDSVAAINGLAE